jgi:predicted negative regulator of RcsB-dependent stress response
LTRHELKEQLQHDAFRDNVDTALDYFTTHREQVIRWVAVIVVVAIGVGVGYWVYTHQRASRDRALQAALEIADAPVMAQSDGFGLSFPTLEQKNAAATKALSDVATKYANTEQGAIARYYLAGLQVSENKYAEAEANFKAVADSKTNVAGLAKVGLAELYAGQGKNDQAQTILEKLVANPGPMVSRAQATIMLANIVKVKDPQRAKQLVDSLKGPTETPAVTEAANQVIQDIK